MVHQIRLFLMAVFVLCATLTVFGLENENDQDDHLSLTRSKRGWNGAKGMWGKRNLVEMDDDENAVDDLEKRAWNKASGMWGKRSDIDENEFSEDKRGTWNKASGMWGKRGGWSGAKGMWGKRKRSAPDLSAANQS